MGDGDLAGGTKDPGTVAGAPFPPATRHSDGPDRPRRGVPTADPAPDVNRDDIPPPTDAEGEEDDHDGDA
jgi:hypothetical protein